MTEAELSLDGLRAYELALSAQRLRAVVSGDVVPRLEEPVDIILLATLPCAETGGEGGA